MPRPIDWKQKHTLAELESAYKRAVSKQHQNRIWAIWQLRQGKTGAEVAASLLVQPRTVYTWLRRYQLEGLAGLLPRPGQGRHEKLALETEALRVLLAERHFSGLAELAQAVEQRYGVSYSPSGLWHLLKRHGIKWKRDNQQT